MVEAVDEDFAWAITGARPLTSKLPFIGAINPVPHNMRLARHPAAMFFFVIDKLITMPFLLLALNLWPSLR